VVDAAGRCIDDLPCYCAALRGRGLRFGAYGSISQLGDLWTIELSLVDSHACTIEATTYSSEELADRDVPDRVAALARKLATPGARARARRPRAAARRRPRPHPRVRPSAPARPPPRPRPPLPERPVTLRAARHGRRQAVGRSDPEPAGSKQNGEGTPCNSARRT